MTKTLFYIEVKFAGNQVLKFEVANAKGAKQALKIAIDSKLVETIQNADIESVKILDRRYYEVIDK